MHSIGWLHLTDFHQGMNSQCHLWPTVREAFFVDLERLHNTSGPWELLLFSGDMTQCGRPEEFSAFTEMLEELLERLNAFGSTPLLLTVPGNHDLIRPRETAAVKMLLKWNEAMDVRNEFWDKPPLKRPGEYGKVILKAFGPFQKWYELWREKHPLPAGVTWTEGIIPGDFAVSFPQNGIELGVIGLNSSFLQLSGKDFKGSLELDVRQAHAVCGGDLVRWRSRHDATILMTHHPIDWLSPRSHDMFRSEIAPPGRFDSHLFGHMHESAAQTISSGGYNLPLQIQGASLFGMEHWGEQGHRIHGYAAGRLALEENRRELRLWPRAMQPTQAGSRSLGPNHSYNLTGDGSLAFPLHQPPRSVSRPSRTGAQGAVPQNVLEGDLAGLTMMIADERSRHLKHFRGRTDEVSKLKSRLEGELREVGGYLLLVGSEGSGKSAICAKLTEELVRQAALREGAKSGRVASAPWLPGSLLHFGKQSGQPREVLQFLFAQMNALLPQSSQIPTMQSGEPDSIALYGLDIDASAHVGLLNGTNPILGRPYLPQHQLICQRRQRALFTALERLVKMRGHAVLVLDALGELNMDQGELAFLPEQLPVGASALITVRAGTQTEALLMERLHPKRVELGAFRREELPLITDLPDEEGQVGRKLNDEIWERTKGWPMAVSMLARELQGNPERAASVEVDVRSILERNARLWQCETEPGKPDLLWETLVLLAMFEPISPLELGLVQSYLEHRKLKFSRGLAELRERLTPIADQLDGWRAQCIKLGLQPFAKYVRDQFCSPIDLRRTMSALIEWLTDESDVDSVVVAGFLHYWTTSAAVLDGRIRTIAETLMEHLLHRHAFDRLGEIGGALWEYENGSALAARYSRVAAEGGCRTAMRALGFRLAWGDGIEPDPEESERLLRAAIAAGDDTSKLVMGLARIVGSALETSFEEGERLLREALAANVAGAAVALGFAITCGLISSKDPGEAERLLRSAAEAGDEFADLLLAYQQIWGTGCRKNLQEGELRLRKAADRGDEPGSFLLGLCVLTGAIPSNEHGEVLRWLDKFAPIFAPMLENLLEQLIGVGWSEMLDIRPVATLLEVTEEGEVLTWVRNKYPHPLAYFLASCVLSVANEGLSEEVPERNAAFVDEELGDQLIKLWNALTSRLKSFAQTYTDTRQVPMPDNLLAWFVMAVAGGKITLRLEHMSLDFQRFLEGYLKILAQSPLPLERWATAIKATIERDDQDVDSENEIGAEDDSEREDEEVGRAVELYVAGSHRAAAECFLKAFERGAWAAGNNLAFMLRRNEIPPDLSIPLAKDLLSVGMEEKFPWAYVNLALCSASGFQCIKNWEEADRIIENLAALGTDAEGEALSNWWHELARNGDPEGHLVVGWLARHCIIDDPEGWPLPQRMEAARTTQFEVPAWMDEYASTQRVAALIGLPPDPAYRTGPCATDEHPVRS